MSSENPDAPDTSASSQVTDHGFVPSEKNEYLCHHCNLGSAAHTPAVPGQVDTSGDSDRMQSLPKGILEMGVTMEGPPHVTEEDLLNASSRVINSMPKEVQDALARDVAMAYDVAVGEENILEEANRLVSQDRQDTYGHPADNFKRLALMWQGVLGVEVTPQQVALCMVCLKVARESTRHARDNVVDIAGYARTLEMTEDRLKEEEDADSADPTDP